MARRGENIYKRKDGRWEGRYIKGRKENGKPCYGYIYGYQFQLLRKRLRHLKDYYEGHQDAEANFTGTLEEWSRCWMEEKAKEKIKPSTYAYYSSMLEHHIYPWFGNQRMDKITEEEIEQFMTGLLEKGLGANASRNVFGMLNRVFRAAVGQGSLCLNPCKKVETPDHQAVRIQAMKRQDQHRLERAAKGDKDGLAVMLALYTGMRMGEICALCWEDVDFVTGTLTVKRTLQRITNAEPAKEKTKLIFGEPKSLHSKRIIPLTSKLLVLLKDAKKGARSKYVISCKGRYAEPRTVSYRYQRILKKAGIEPLHFHGLRHTFATRCIETGMDITALSRVLGHSSIKLTMDVYLDVTLEHKAKCISKLDYLYGFEDQMIG